MISYKLNYDGRKLYRITKMTPMERKAAMTWRSIKSRCLSKEVEPYQDYGARGITICDRWLNSLEAFVEDVGLPQQKSDSIDRINVDGNYEPGNCRWATRSQQMRNIRTNHLVTIDGETQPVIYWAEKAGISHGLMLFRLRCGWTGQRLLGPARPKAAPIPLIEINGESGTCWHWAKKTGLSPQVIYERWKRGIRGEALIVPARPYGVPQSS